MQHPRSRRIGAGLGMAAVAAAALFTGACGSGPSADAARSGDGTRLTAVATPAEVDVRRELRGLETSYKGRIGAYAIDTGTGRTVGYRGHERFPSNSTFKAPLCGAVLHKARTTDPGLMGRTLRWTKEDLVEHSPVTGLETNLKNGLNPAQLCHATVTVSDNTAANLLLEQIGGPSGMTRYYRSLGDPVGRLDRTETALNDWKPGEKRDTIMPAFMASDLRALTLGGALVPEDRGRLNAWLRATSTSAKRIRAGLPKDWTVGDKTGTGGPHSGAHDIAVVWPTSGAPLIIAVYTHRNAATPEYDESVIAKTATVLARGLGRLP
ncbi:class A beta-lactamase [Spirillospora sp. CA-294931]|uniref:class A beta-lactamase n=1 Tax=Spirillospora sp. CA-294931 TaxID=3240042 RepID=UPI003D9479F9